MPFSLFVALHHLLSKKRVHATNTIAWIAMLGVSISAMAIVVVLSVFNGIESLVSSMYSTLDTDLKIVPSQGKVFRVGDALQALQETLPQGGRWGCVLEENALFSYGGRQHVGTMLGMDTAYASMSQLASHSIEGSATLYRGSQPLAILASGVAYYLGASPSHYDPLAVYVPNRLASNWLNPATAFHEKRYAFDAIVSINAGFDEHTVVLPISEVQKLLSYDGDVASAVHINLPHGASISGVQQLLRQKLGAECRVLNRMEQNESLYKTMRGERLVIIVILALILLIATFNVVGSLSMLIIEKRDDILQLRYLGARYGQVRQIFLLEGVLIALSGGVAGVVLGLLICWLQQTFGIVRLGGSGNFIVQAYPVEVHASDILLVVALVAGLGLLASLAPLGTMRIARDDAKR